MKQLTFLSKIFFVFLAITFWSSCEEDGPGGGGITLPPVVELQSGADLVTSATTLDAGATFKVSIVADKGDNDMVTFAVLEDGVAIPSSRLNYNGTGPLDNPYTLIPATESTTFAPEIEITAHTDGGTRTYTFRITDSAGETDDANVDITVVTTPLTLGVSSANGGVSADATFDTQASFKVELAATKGSSPLNTLTVFEDGTAVDASRVRFGVDDDLLLATTASANPIALIDDEKNGFTWFVWVSSHDSGTKEYSFVVEDEALNTETVSFNITIIPKTPVAEYTGKLLVNADNIGVNTGGINLLTGEGTASMSADAHLRDSGIDVTQVGSDWIRKISAVNGAELRTPGTEFPIDDYFAVEYAEDISIAFDNGNIVSVSEKVNEFDKFLVRTATGETILVYIAEISETATSGNNDDYYNLSIKY